MRPGRLEHSRGDRPTCQRAPGSHPAGMTALRGRGRMSDHPDLRSGGVPFGASWGEGLTAMEFPFQCRLSLALLVAYWNQAVVSGHPAKAALAKQIQDELRQAAELLEPIEDLSLIEHHQGLVDLLMSAVFPPTSWDRDYAAATIPFHFQSFCNAVVRSMAHGGGWHLRGAKSRSRGLFLWQIAASLPLHREEVLWHRTPIRV